MMAGLGAVPFLLTLGAAYCAKQLVFCDFSLIHVTFTDMF
jgi:hypothetical protein